MLKNWHSQTALWSWDVEKLHAAVARRTFLSKWKCTKHVSFGPLLEVAMSKNCAPLWREANFQVKMLKNWGVRSIFWSCDVEKLHAAVARSTFPSQNVKKLTVSEHFLKLRCWKIARRCGEKHISKSRSTFWSWDVEKLHAAVARSTFPSQNAQKLTVSDHFLKFRCRKISPVVS